MKTIYQTLIALIIFGAVTFAQVPRTISYQGILTDGTGANVLNGNYQLQLSLYLNASGGVPIYNETQTVSVFSGVYNVTIGSVTPIPTSVAFDHVYYLGVSVQGGNELIPRTVLTSVPYSLRSSVADVAQSLASGAVVTNINNQSGNITLKGGGTTSITDNGSGTFTISSTGGSGGTGIQGVQNTDGALSIQNPNGPVATIDLNNNGITKQKIASGQVVKSLNNMQDDVTLVAGSNVTLTPNGSSLTISATGGSGGNGIKEIASGNGTINVVNGQGPLATINVADNGIGTAQIANASVTTQKLAAGVIPTSLPPIGAAYGDLSGTYPGPNIAANAVVTSKIADGAVTLQKLAPGLIPTSLPPSGSASGDLSGTYPGPSIAANAVVTSKIVDNAVTTGKLADGSVTPAKISSSGAASGNVLQYNGTNVVWGAAGGPWSTSGADISNTNTGNVGIGTTSPDSKLHINGNVRINGSGYLYFQDASSGPNYFLHSFGGAVSGMQLNGFNVVKLSTGQGDILNVVDDKVGIGTASPDSKLQINGDVHINGSGYLYFQGGSSDPHYFLHSFGGAVSGMQIYGYNAVRLSTGQGDILNVIDNWVGIGTTVYTGYKLDVNGSLHCIGFSNTSDVRYKKDIVVITNALSKVLSMRGVYYNWKTESFPDKNFTNERQVGFIAQEVEKVLPEVVSTAKDSYKGVDYSKISALLVEAVKEQQKEIETLKKEVENIRTSRVAGYEVKTVSNRTTGSSK